MLDDDFLRLRTNEIQRDAVVNLDADERTERLGCGQPQHLRQELR